MYVAQRFVISIKQRKSWQSSAERVTTTSQYAGKTVSKARQNILDLDE